MAKRFGRNQRRRMREAQEELEFQLQKNRAAHLSIQQLLERQIAELQAQIDHVRKCGAALVNSRILPPETVVEGYDWPRRWNATPQEHACAPIDLNATALAHVSIVDLYRFGFAIESNPRACNLLVHFFCEGAGELANQWRYMISPKALQKVGLSPDAQRRFATCIAAELVAAASDMCTGKRTPKPIRPPQRFNDSWGGW